MMLAWFAVGAQARADAPRRPNIVLIVAEDLSPRIGSFGDPVARTPRIDRLASDGIRYPNTFTTSGVCAPSRAALITGMHQNAIDAQHMRTSTFPGPEYRSVPPPEVKAFPELLRAAGYYATVNFKLDYQFSGVFVGTGPFTIWDGEGEDASWHDRPEGAPFFAMFNLMETHESGVFSPVGTWPNSGVHLVMQLARAWQFGWGAGREVGPDPAAIELPPYYPDTSTVRRDLARHYANIERMDAHVGRILDGLAEDDLLDETIVIFTTDHGDGLPRAKRELFDSGIRVPMIVRWPEGLRPEHLAAVGVDEQLVSFVDLAPAILNMAGVPAPASMHGRDFLDPIAAPRNTIHAARDRIDEVVDRQRAVRDAHFKYIRSDHPDVPGGHPLDFRDNIAMVREMRRLHQEGKLDAAQERWFEAPGRERLYDLNADPHELRDVSGQPSYHVHLARLRSAMDAWLERVGDVSETPETKTARSAWPEGVAPVTATPAFEEREADLVIRCETDGASIGYRVGSGPWRLYSGPISPGPGRIIEAKAVRYGWAESETASFETREVR